LCGRYTTDAAAIAGDRFVDRCLKTQIADLPYHAGQMPMPLGAGHSGNKFQEHFVGSRFFSQNLELTHSRCPFPTGQAEKT